MKEVHSHLKYHSSASKSKCYPLCQILRYQKIPYFLRKKMSSQKKPFFLCQFAWIRLIPGNFPSRDSRPTPLVGWDSGGCGLSPNKKKELWNRSHWNFVNVEMVPIVKFKGGNSPTFFLRSWNRSQKVFLWGGIGPKKFLGVGIGPTNFFREWDLFHTIFYCGTYSTPSKLMVE